MKPFTALVCAALLVAGAPTAARADQSAIAQLLLKESHWVFVRVDSKSGEGVPVWFARAGRSLQLHTRDADAPPCEVQVHDDGFTATGCVPSRWRWVRGEAVWPFRAAAAGTEYQLRPASVVPTGRAHGGP